MRKIVKKRFDRRIRKNKSPVKNTIWIQKRKRNNRGIYVVSKIIEKNIEKKREKLCMCFTDIKALFNNLKRKEI